MFDHFKIRRSKTHHPQVDEELVGDVATLAMKIIGATVKGKVLRAVLAAGVAGTTAYLAPSQEPPVLPSSEPPQASPLPVPEVVPPDTVCSADHLDWRSTAAGH